MKRVGAVVSAVLGGISCLMAGSLAVFLLCKWVDGGRDDTEQLRAASFCVGSLVLAVLWMRWGLRQLRPKNPDARTQDREKKATIPRPERWRRPDAALPPGAKLWKYRADGASPGLFTRYRTGYVLGSVLAALALTIAVTVASMALPPRARNTLLLAMVLIVTAALVAAALRIGRVSYGMLVSFGRDGKGRMWFFDYMSPAFQAGRRSGTGGSGKLAAYFRQNRAAAQLIREIDESHLLERLIRSGACYPYGQQIVRVLQLREGPQSCQVLCDLKRQDGSLYTRNLLIPMRYEDYGALTQALRELGSSGPL